MEAIYRKMSRAARMLGYHYSGQSHEYMDYTEKLLSKWSLPAESEELDPDFQRSFLDATDCSTEVSDDISHSTLLLIFEFCSDNQLAVLEDF